MVDTTLTQVLTNVGLNDKEARVYLALLTLGTGSVSAIATKAELKRPIAYYILATLQQKGYATEVAGKKTKHFAAADPLRIFHGAQSALEELRFMLPMIRGLQEKSGGKPRIEYLEGKDAVVSIYRFFDKRKSARFLTSIKHLEKIIPDEVEKWVRRYEAGANVRNTQATLLTDSPADRAWGKRALAVGQNVRLLPLDSNIEMDFSIVDDVLSVTSFDPLFIVVIHSERIARSAAGLFDLAWRSARELPE